MIEVYNLEQTTSSLHLFRYSHISKVLVAYAPQGLHRIEKNGKDSSLVCFLSSTFDARTARSNTSYFLGTVGCRKWNALDDKPVTTGTWSLIEVNTSARLAILFLLLGCVDIIPVVTTMVFWNSLPCKPWWSSAVGKIVGLIPFFAEAMVYRWPAYLWHPAV